MNRARKIINARCRPGFTLIEIITVLFVLTIGLLGVLALIVQSIYSQSYNKNNLIAYQLAQEGIELIRKTRDSNWLQSVDWRTNLSDGLYYMDYMDSSPHSSGLGGGFLWRDANGFYFDNPGNSPMANCVSSGFLRTIALSTKDAHSFYVDVRVNWFDHNRTFSYVLETTLYNWR